MLRCAALLGLLLAAACHSPQQPEPAPPPEPTVPREPVAVPRASAGAPDVADMNYDPEDLPRAWLPGGELVISHLERYSENDFFRGACAGSGFYAIGPDGRAPRPLAVSQTACAAIRQPTLGVAADGESAVFPRPRSPSWLLRLDFATARVDTLVPDCPGILMRPALAPDGRIAAIGDCNRRGFGTDGLYVMGPNGAGLYAVARGRHAPLAPAWSPDGARIAVTARSRIQVMRLDGGLQTLARGEAPAWSPDGERIAFVVRPAALNAPSALYVIRPDGSARRRVFRNEVRTTFARGLGPELEGNVEGAPVWSPDSRWIAFARRFDAGTSVWRVEVETGRVEQLTRPAR